MQPSTPILRVVITLAVGCTSESLVDPEPPTRPESPFTEAIDRLSPSDRAYVVGHATGVRLYAQTLPPAVAGTGFAYVPGNSSPHARVAYRYDEVVTIAGATPCDCSGGDCYGDCGPGSTDPSEPPPDDGEECGDGCPPDDMIDEDCETFLDPAAMIAREMAAAIDADDVVAGLDPTRFRQGLTEALSLEDLDEATDYSEIEHTKEHVQDAGLCEHSPLVLDLAGNGLEASAPEVRFDLKATGVPFLVAWPRGDDALLAYDRDGDGRITDGAELFGNHGAPNGFAALASLDNGDGVIDARDQTFASLRLWRDANRDGVSDAGELVPLSAVGVASISLSYVESDRRDPFGNALAQVGSFRRADGTQSTIVDVWFRLRR